MAYDRRPVQKSALADTNQPSPEALAPLAAFKGAEPPAPQWFKDALAREPERGFVDSLGSKIETLTWGETGKPGLLFVHGNTAHADWWSFIAPFFADDYRVCAMSVAGMGGSDWRERYAFADFVQDAEAVARATGLYEGGKAPIYIGHSLGGMHVHYAAARHPEHMQAAILVDVGFGGPPAPTQPVNPAFFRPPITYPALDMALVRFRFMPPQTAVFPCAVDLIARRGLTPAPNDAEAFAWRFDPNWWDKLDRAGVIPDSDTVAAISLPLAHIVGTETRVVKPEQADLFPPHTVRIEIPGAQHHIMVDQPLALVSAIRALLAGWEA
ncbi:MAG: alpha/beta hydrolase [Phenylobacterium sp.]|uniref:alpha/beta fold hydrolase n=1 Tax=Phenylobacterium sp. TaxID=1871053 RepID=UPI0027336572|nr:alpha/beta hydrolase [Phenylobacterium sp.]MDP3175593.1 alpha/beta hydrolase [Phenylobacterium sp.]